MLLLARCLHELPNDVCEYVKDIVLDHNGYFYYNKIRNIIHIDGNTILNNFNELYDNVNTFISLYNPKIEILMHYSNKCRCYGNYVFFESELPDYILDEWFIGLDLQKIIMVWNGEYFR